MPSKNALFYRGVVPFSILLDVPDARHYRHYYSFRRFPDIEEKNVKYASAL